MRSTETQDWQKVSPLIYSYLASLPVKEFASISTATVTKRTDNTYFKFEEYRTVIAGHSEAFNGILTINTLLLPQARDLDDDRMRAVLNKHCQLNFESEVTHFDECVQNGQQGPWSTYLVVTERRSPQIYVYDSNGLKGMEKARVNPRMVMKGHESQITALRCRREEILSGAKNGEVRLHNLRFGENSVIYKYHREQVNDCCWLTPQEDSNFISASSDGLIYLWDKRTSIPSLKIEPKQGELNCLEYLRENCFLSGGKDGTIKLYDVRSGVNKFYIFKDHSAPVTCIKRLDSKESKEGEVPHQILFASGAANGEVLLWGEELEFAHLNHRNEVKCISYECSTEIFATVEKKNAALCLWRPAIFNYQ